MKTLGNAVSPPEVFPILKHRFPRKDALQHRTFIVIGYSESVLAGMLDDYEQAMPGNVHLAYLPKPGLIRLRHTGTDTDASRLEAVMAEQSDKLASILGKSLIC